MGGLGVAAWTMDSRRVDKLNNRIERPHQTIIWFPSNSFRTLT